MYPDPAQPATERYPLSALNVFPAVSSAAAFTATTGLTAPPFDPTKFIKDWYDPDAVLLYVAAGKGPVDWSKYTGRGIQAQASLIYMPAKLANGQPYNEPIVVAKSDAAFVNVAPAGFTYSAPAPLAGIPNVLRDFKADETLDTGPDTLFSGPTVIRTDMPAPIPAEPDSAAVLAAITQLQAQQTALLAWLEQKFGGTIA